MGRKAERTFELLSGHRGERAREVLLGGLEEPDETIQARSVSLLMLNHADADLAPLLDRFDELEPKARLEVAAGHDRLLPAIRTALRTGRVGRRENAIDILATVGHSSQAPLIAGALTDTAASVRKRATSTLLTMARHWKEANAEPNDKERSRWQTDSAQRELLGALKHAVQSYTTHGETAILEAFLLLGPGAYRDLIALVEDGSAQLASDCAETLERLAKQLDPGLLVTCSMSRSLKIKAVALKILASPQAPKFVTDLEQYLDQALQTSPFVLGSDPSEGWWSIGASHLDALSERFQLKMVVQATAQLKGEACLTHLAGLTLSPFSKVRREVLLAAREQPAEGGRDMIVFMLADPDEQLQLMATQELVGWGAKEKMEPLLTRMRSDFQSVRSVAMAELSRIGFDRYLSNFDSLDGITRRRAGAALSQIGGGLPARLLDELTALEPERRIKALRMVEAIEKATDVQNEILELVADPDKKVRATAVGLLGAIGSGKALQAMVESLSDPDPRIRANAIQAFEELHQPTFADILLPFVRSNEVRIRANTVKALWHLKHPDAGKHLIALVKDRSEAARCSAAWLLGELPVKGARPALERLAQTDPSETVRSKAQQILQQKGSAR